VNGHPFNTFVQAGQDRGCFRAQGCFIRGDKARMLCPVHRDCKPSLGVLRREHDILFHCMFCGTKGKPAILQALGLTNADLFDGPRPPMVMATISATYSYMDLNGVLLAEKVRMSNKDFWWRRPDPHARGGWRHDRGAGVGVYHLHDLIDIRTIYVTEGEKSCDRLRSLGLPGTCGPDGAGTWRPEWSQALYDVGGREFVVFADHDKAGEHHAALVARITIALEVAEPITVKVVRLPNLMEKQDVYDYVASGHDADDLLAVVADTPFWTPDDRKARKRRLNREWMQRRRADIRSTTPDVRSVTSSVLDIRNTTDVVLASCGAGSERVRTPYRAVTLSDVVQCERSSSTLQESVVEDLLSVPSSSVEHLQPLVSALCSTEKDGRTANPDVPPLVESPRVLTCTPAEILPSMPDTTQAAAPMFGIDEEEILPAWVTDIDEPLGDSVSDMPLAMRDEDAELQVLQVHRTAALRAHHVIHVEPNLREKRS
jgi:hypothetical protein